MKNLLAIILLLSIALPSSGWGRVVSDSPCEQVMAKSKSCHCCPAGQCGCAKSDEQAPAHPSPTLPPRPTSTGDPVFLIQPSDFTLRVMEPAAHGSRVPPIAEVVSDSRQSVPLQIRHCALLW